MQQGSTIGQQVLSLCDDRTLRVQLQVLVSRVHASQQAVLYRKTSLWVQGDSH